VEQRENGFDSWKHHILKELERLSSSQEKVAKQMETLIVELAMLRVKSGVWGLIGGAIPVMVAIAMYLIERINQ